MQAQMSIHEKEQRIRQYKSDENIKMFQEIISKVLILAKPKIIVCIGDPDKSIFDIDEDSKVVVEYWKQKMEEYILINYPDIITTTSGS